MSMSAKSRSCSISNGMDPKFQSSFIPKGHASTAVPVSGMRGRSSGQRTVLGLIATVLFVCSIIAAAGVFGYKYYLKYDISSLASQLEEAKLSLGYDEVQELIELDSRIISAETIINNHVILSPVFEFLEQSTVRNVRFTRLDYSSGQQGLSLSLEGEAAGYSALALQSDIFNQSPHLLNQNFSDISLNEEGRVAFKFSAAVNPETISFRKELERIFVPETTPDAVQEEVEPAAGAEAADGASVTATSTATTTTQQ